MVDDVFGDPRLARLYDPLDPDRSDLDPYVALVAELGARRVLDMGCGTGTFAVLLAAHGIDVVGVDPALASLDVARGKPHADRVRWVHGTAPDLRALGLEPVDLATMTANVAQAIVDPDDWHATLAAAHDLTTPGGHLVLETRVPSYRAWLEWTPERSRSVVDVAGVGRVETWHDVTEVALPLVSFTATVVLPTGERLTSRSTLRFRELDEVEADLRGSGYAVRQVRDAPDRPGREYVVLARRDSGD